jgi:hypothetical protein
MPLPRRQPGLRHRRQDADEETSIDGKLPAPAEFTGNQQRLIVGTLAKPKGMERDRDDEVGKPIRGSALIGSVEEAGKGAIKSQAAVKLEAVDGMAQRLFIKAGGDSPGKIRRLEEAFPADMVTPADGGKGESTARTTRGGDRETAVKTAGTEGGIR